MPFGSHDGSEDGEHNGNSLVVTSDIFYDVMRFPRYNAMI